MLGVGEIHFRPFPPLKSKKNFKSKKLPSEEEKKLEKLVHKTHTTLLNINSIFPFDLFPDQISIDEIKVSIVTSEFFGTERLYTILLTDINEVLVETNIFFAALRIFDKNFPDQPYVVKFLNRDEAQRAKRIIEGLKIVKEQGIDLSEISPDILVQKLEEVGEGGVGSSVW